MTAEQKQIDQAILTGLTVEDACMAYAQHGIEWPVSGDGLAGHRAQERAARRLAQIMTDAFRPIFEAIKQAWGRVQRALRPLQSDYVLTDQKVAARIRQGHPPIPRQPLMHNGRKPRR